ncbi:MAG: isoprenylcysteine carboxylmethyltransferase family protein [Pseudomonadota bacterium]
MKGFPDLPPLWLAGFCLLTWFCAREIPIGYFGGPVLQLLAGLLSLSGLLIIAWSAIWFQRKGTTIEPHEQPATLIIEGPYRLSRNPIYLGMVMILLALVLWYGALSPIIFPGLFISVLTLRFILPEEEMLRTRFGAEADRYLATTRRWI